MIGICLGDARYRFTYPDGRDEHGTAAAGIGQRRLDEHGLSI